VNEESGMRVVVVGLGYLGLTVAVGLAHSGHDVVGVEQNPDRLDLLRRHGMPFFEPGLGVALTTAAASGRLSFSADLMDVTGPTDAIIVAVGSPPLPDGGADVTQVEQVLGQVLALAPATTLVVVKSSVPPGTSDAWAASGRFPDLAQRYVYVPEFLNQGTALHNWTNPHRIVLGGWDNRPIGEARKLFGAVDTTYVITTPAEAEAIKYTSNAFLAMRISFANEIAGLCEAVGADIEQVLHGMGLDPRIGPLFWRPGIGYGDSCLPKDVSALIHRAAAYGQRMPILETVQATNQAQHLKPLAILRQERSRLSSWPPRIAVLGLAYEPHSDDVRAAPSLSLVPQFRLVTPEITVWDPLLTGSMIAELFPFAHRAGSPAEAVRDANVVVVLTEYPDIVSGQWLGQIRHDGRPVLVIDGKNCLPTELLDHDSTVYRAVGKPHSCTH
jgi:UDPglucose 6-dehydrogenase